MLRSRHSSMMGSIVVLMKLPELRPCLQPVMALSMVLLHIEVTTCCKGWHEPQEKVDPTIYFLITLDLNTHTPGRVTRKVTGYASRCMPSGTARIASTVVCATSTQLTALQHARATNARCICSFNQRDAAHAEAVSKYAADPSISSQRK